MKDSEKPEGDYITQEEYESGEACAVNYHVQERCCSDRAFSGPTHASSAVAIFMLTLVIVPDFAFAFLGGSGMWLLIGSGLNMFGSSLSPDMDNTRSTSKSSLGILGSFISTAFRTLSVFVQSILRSKSDSAEPNPHRGLFHSIFGAALMALVAWFAVNLKVGSFDLPLFGIVNLGFIAAVIIVWMNTHMAIAGLAKRSLDRFKKKSGILGEFNSFLVSFSATVMVFYSLPPNTTLTWIPATVFAGVVVHILGDAFTKQGVPLLAPLKIKGKRWYQIRFAYLTSGGDVDKFLFIVFSAISVICFFVLMSQGASAMGY